MSEQPVGLVIDIGIEAVDENRHIYHLRYPVSKTESDIIDQTNDLTVEEHITELGRILADKIRGQYGVNMMILRYYEVFVEKASLFSWNDDGIEVAIVEFIVTAIAKLLEIDTKHAIEVRISVVGAESEDASELEDNSEADDQADELSKPTDE